MKSANAAESLAEIGWIFQEQALPLVSRQPGFRGVYLMVKPNGELMVLNISETEDQANAWPQNPEHQKVVAQLKPLFTGPAARDGYEVRVCDVSPP